MNGGANAMVNWCDPSALSGPDATKAALTCALIGTDPAGGPAMGALADAGAGLAARGDDGTLIAAPVRADMV